MCCCTCVKGYSCMGWIFSSIFFGVLLVVLFAGIRIGFGGNFPTQDWETGSALVYVSAVFTIISSILAFLAIVKFVDKILALTVVLRWIVFGVTNGLLLLTVLLLLSATILISKKVTKENIINYSEQYKKANNEAPPGLHTIESLSSSLKQGNVPLGCCGYNDFNDYLVFGDKGLKACDNTTANLTDRHPILFTAPKVCCKKGSCENVTALEHNFYLSYDIQLFIHRLFNKKAAKLNKWDDVQKLSKVLGQNFSDWISGEGNGGVKKQFGEGELPPPDQEITYRPRLDCEYAVKTRMKVHLGNWDNKTEWEGTGDMSKGKAGDNYIKSVGSDVRTSVLGCGEWVQLLLEGNQFVKLAFENNQLGPIFGILMALHSIIIIFVVIFLLHVILNMFWFNYYYIPTIIFPGKCNLPFFPKKNKVLPSSPSATNEPAKEPSPNEDVAANPEEGGAVEAQDAPAPTEQPATTTN